MKTGDNTYYYDADERILHIGDRVEMFGAQGTIVFECGALGIAFDYGVPWDKLEEATEKECGNKPHFLYNDNFLSLWEILWNLSDDTDTAFLPVIRKI